MRSNLRAGILIFASYACAGGGSMFSLVVETMAYCRDKHAAMRWEEKRGVKMTAACGIYE
jgi:hypothetical protein